jgi:hypothetical protein
MKETMVSKSLVALLACSCAVSQAAAPLSCAAGVPLGGLELSVLAGGKAAPLPLRGINRLAEGNRVRYSPVRLRRKGGKVALVVAPAAPKPGAPAPKIEVLEPKSADKRQEWVVPFRAGVVALVYGPDGLSSKKVKRFLAQDEDLVAQLADYAEKTAQTEALVTALGNWGAAGSNDSFDGALHGFASQYGISGAIDRSLPRDQQMLAVLRAVNPALSSVDPVSPDPAQRMQQSAVLATSIAGMFLGSTVGLAASGGALFLNLRSMMFPGAEFRSSFAQVAPGPSAELSLCGKREAAKPRTRVAYIWAARIPDAAAPALTIGPRNHVPERQQALVAATADDSAWRILDRARDWRLQPADRGSALPVKVRAIPEQKELEIDLKSSPATAGRYRLAASWDWDTLSAGGDLVVAPLSDFRGARVTPESQDRLRERAGKTVAQAHGADFEFVENIAVVRTGDKYTPPANIPFSLPKGRQQGPQDGLEFELDTRPLAAGDYSLLLTQTGAQPIAVPFKVLAPGPKISNLPLLVNAGEEEQTVELKGENLDRLTRLEAEGASFEWEPPAGTKGDHRNVRVRLHSGAAPGATMELRAFAQDTSQPQTLAGGLRVIGPRPAIRESQLSLPPATGVELRPGELPAGAFVSASLRVRHAGPETRVRLRCGDAETDEVAVRVGTQTAGASLQAIGADTLFLSFDSGRWQTGCVVSALLDNGAEGMSKPHPLGRVVRLPRVENFQLTDEKTASGDYVGKLTGSGLETIAKVGWTAEDGIVVEGLPAPVEGSDRKQSLAIELPWPPPSPHAPLYIWFRGENAGRLTNVRY